MGSIYSNLKTNKQFKGATGINIEEFNKLLKIFYKYYTAKNPSPIKNTKLPVLTNIAEALFFILHYLKAYPTLENMGLYFGMDVRTVSNYLERTKVALRKTLIEYDALCWSIFKNQEEFDKAFEGIDELVVDCTEVQIQRPKGNENQELMYSGKKKLHTIKLLVISTILGTVKYVGLLWNGKSADINLFRIEFNNLSFKNKKVYVDLGFLGIQSELKDAELVIPHKKPKMKTLTEEQKKENRIISAIRVIVENALAGIKHFFICSIRNRFHKMSIILDNFNLCAGLSNFKGLKRKELIFS